MKKRFPTIILGATPIMFLASCSNEYKSTEDFKIEALNLPEFKNLKEKINKNFSNNKNLFSDKNFIDSLSKSLNLYADLKPSLEKEEIKNDIFVIKGLKNLKIFLNSENFDFSELITNLNNYITILKKYIDSAKKMHKNNVENLQKEISNIFLNNINSAFANIKEIILNKTETNYKTFSSSVFKSELLNNLKSFNKNKDKEKELSKYTYEKDSDIIDINNQLLKFLNKENYSFENFNNEFSTLNNQLKQVLEKKEKIFVFDLEDFKNLIEQLSKNQEFDVNLITFVKNHIENVFNTIENENGFLSQIQQINGKIKEISQIKEIYNDQLSTEIKEKINNFESIKNNNFSTLNSLTNIENTVINLIEDITNHIISNNNRSNELSSQINNLIEKINSNQHLSQQQKTDLISGVNKVITEDQLSSFEKELKSKNSEFLNEIKSFLDIVNENSSISQSFKNYLKVETYTKENLEDFNSFKNEINSFFELLNKVKEEFLKTNLAIDENKINAYAVLPFFLKQEALDFSKIYDNEKYKLLDFDIKDLPAIKTKINDFYSKLKEFNEQNITTTTNDETSLKSSLLSEVQKHNTVSLSKDPNGYDVERYLHSASINLNNYKVFINEGDDETFDFDVVNLELKEDNKNILVLTLDVFLKSNRKLKSTIKKEIPFQKDVMPFINKVVLNNLDQFYEVDYEALSKLSYSEFNLIENKKIFFKPRTKGIENFFSFDITSFETYKENRLYFQFNVLFNKQIIKSKILPTLNPVDFLNTDATQSEKDAKDFAQIENILKGTKEHFWSLLKFKPGIFYTHSEFLAADAKKAMEEIYDLPKFGKYQIFVKDVNNIDNYNGSADLILWYKINGEEAPIQALGDLYNHPIKMINFRLFDLEDIKPKTGNNLTEADFDGFDQIDQNDLNILRQLNESNIQQVRVNGQIQDNGNPSNYFSIINAKDFVQQQQFYKASYLFQITNGTNNKTDNKDNLAYIPFGTGNYSKDVQPFSISSGDVSRIKNKYFIYYYDFELVGKRGLNFKIGFIEKEHQNKRFSTKQKFSMVNFVNDYQQLHYPEIMLNNLTLDDLQIDKERLATNTVGYFNSHKNELRQIITIKNQDGFISYKNYDLAVSEIKINEIQQIDETSAYIRFSLVKFGVEDPEYVRPWNKNANSWYKITGFKPSSITNKRTAPSYDERRDTNSLRTIYNSENEIHRERTLELYWKDALWSVDKEANILSWTLQHKILDPLFKNSYTSNRKLNLSFNGGAINHGDTEITISPNPAFDIELDYDEIKDQKIINIEKIVTKNNTDFTFKIQARWMENEDIEFSVWPKNPEIKIVIDPREEAKSVVHELSNYNFLFAAGAATLKVKYDSTKQTEDFGWETNLFDYSKVEPNTFSQPTIFFNKPEYLFDHSIYNPNSNVAFKFHEGYKMRLEPLRLREYGKYSQSVRNVIGRAIAYSPGGAIATASMIGKVNDDPNDGRFYVMTNHHAESSSIHDFSLISGDNLFFKSSDKTISAPFLQARTYASRGRYGWTDYTSTSGNESTTIWIGIQQYNLNGDPLKNTGKTPERLDSSIIIIDINPGIAKAREEGKFDLALYLENWFKLSNSNIDYTWRYNDMNSPTVKDIVSIGYPRGNQTAILDHRPISNYWSGWKWGFIIANETNYAPFYSGAGASGTGRFIDDNSLASLWNSGVGFQYSISWNYDGQDYNYFGVNWKGEHPFELKNKHSFASQIIRANAVNPNKYDLPWFMKEIKEK
ncbi:MGA_1079 family surface serine endopeptidase [Mycoplasma sp. 480]|uniref:MGA_1079 family surface serine endopeptidase n=1 Tax=Mycoplasma sp. 480 TaxID=3440155 RepID=UPI003F50DD53